MNWHPALDVRPELGQEAARVLQRRRPVTAIGERRGGTGGCRWELWDLRQQRLGLLDVGVLQPQQQRVNLHAEGMRQADGVDLGGVVNVRALAHAFEAKVRNHASGERRDVLLQRGHRGTAHVLADAAVEVLASVGRVQEQNADVGKGADVHQRLAWVAGDLALVQLGQGELPDGERAVQEHVHEEAQDRARTGAAAVGAGEAGRDEHAQDAQQGETHRDAAPDARGCQRP
eukprot:scaffold1220_cov259-Pinguiococcus_pyrenoidosus.AAC.126